MDLRLHEDQLMIADTVAAFVRDRVLEQGMHWNEHGGDASGAVREVGELGILGLLAPEIAGGAGMGAVELAIALEELAYGDAGLAALVAIHNTGVVAALAGGPGNDGVGADVVERLATGQALGCVLRDGDEAALGAAFADVFVLAGPQTKVWTSGDGVERKPVAWLGLRSAGPATVATDRDPDAVISDVDVKRVHGLRRVAAAAIAVGIGKRALEAGVRYTLDRKQFGKPIARFQALQWMTADAATELETARLLTRRAAWLHDAKRPFADAAARAANLAVRHVRAITDRCLQMHGGYGYTADFPVERLYRDAYALHAVSGDLHAVKVDIATTLAAAV